MVQIDETTLGVAFAVLGVLGSLVWYGLAYYGIRTLQDVRDRLGEDAAARDGR